MSNVAARALLVVIIIFGIGISQIDRATVVIVVADRRGFLALATASTQTGRFGQFIVIIVVVKDIVVVVVVIVTTGGRGSSTATATLRRFAIVEPFRKDVDGFVQVVNGHLVGRPAQPTRQTANAGLEIHFAFDRVVIGAKGAFEALG
jgi:hypothetical protein